MSGLFQNIPGLVLTREDRESVTRLVNESGERERQLLIGAINSGSTQRIVKTLQDMATVLGCYKKPINRIAARIESASIADTRPPQPG